MGSEQRDLAGTARREVEDARARLSEAAGRVKQEAISAGSTISSLVYDEIDRRGADLSEGLHHIAEKMRDMADTGEGEPPRMVQQAVDVIDDLSVRLRSRSSRDLGESVARFGRENPVTFMAACLATGVLAGRFLIAQSDGSRDGGGYGGGYGSNGGTGRRPGGYQGDFGYRDPSDLDQDDWTGDSGFGAGSESGMAPDDPSDLDLGPDDIAGNRGAGIRPEDTRDDPSQLLPGEGRDERF